MNKQGGVQQNATKEEIAERKRKCSRLCCCKTGWLETWTGDTLCLKHYIEDMKYKTLMNKLFVMFRLTKYRLKKLLLDE